MPDDERAAREAFDRAAEQAEQTPEEVRAEALKLIKEGKVEIMNPAYKKGPNEVVVTGFAGASVGLVFSWSREGVGFGELTFKVGQDGILHVEREGMGTDFCLDVLRQALTEAAGEEVL